jgi:hypothetical protein
VGKAGINIAAELEPVAREAARIVGQQHIPGNYVVIIRGQVLEDDTATVGWEWFFHLPAETIPDSGPVKLGE